MSNIEHVILKNNTTGENEIRKSIEVDGKIVLFDENEIISDDSGNIYNFSIEKITEEEKEKMNYDRIINGIIDMVRYYNTNNKRKIYFDKDTFHLVDINK